MRKKVAKLIRNAVTTVSDLEGKDLKRAIRNAYKAWNSTPRHRIQGAKKSTDPEFVADRHQFRKKLEELVKDVPSA